MISSDLKCVQINSKDGGIRLKTIVWHHQTNSGRDQNASGQSEQRNVLHCISINAVHAVVCSSFRENISSSLVSRITGNSLLVIEYFETVEMVLLLK